MIIYKTTNLINGKIYIGQTITNKTNYLGSGKIIKEAIKKYGKQNFKLEILETCNSIKHLNERERYWIETLKSRDKNIGYNIDTGGNANWNNQSLTKLSESHKHQKPTEEHKEMLRILNSGSGHPQAKVVYQYDEGWNFINRFDCLKDASEVTGVQLQNISAVCRGKRFMSGGFRWTFEKINSVDEGKEYILKMQTVTPRNIKRLSISERKKLSDSHNKQKKSVYQFSLEGDLLREFSSIREASKIVGAKHISRCCKNLNNYRTSGGFKWSFSKSL